MFELTGRGDRKTQIWFVPNVHATTFHEYKGQVESLAYAGDFLRNNPTARVAALPFTFEKDFRSTWAPPIVRPEVDVTRLGSGVYAIPLLDGHYSVATVLDIGPWMTNDPYWRLEERPRAEMVFVQGGQVYSPQRGAMIRVTSPAAIDLTPAVWEDLGVPHAAAWGQKFSARIDLAIVEARG